ncbi:MAG: SCP2 sterol-binding domain-containing protein, partial [Natronosporangium sp.]
HILGRFWGGDEPDPPPPTRIQQRMIRILAGLSESQIARLERGLPRRALLWLAAAGLLLRFNPAEAGDLAATLELRLLRPDGGDPDPVAIVIANGRCRVRRHAAAKPDASCAVSIGDLIRLTTGATKLHILWLSGDLVTSGDTDLFLRFPSLFSGRRRP